MTHAKARLAAGSTVRRWNVSVTAWLVCLCCAVSLNDSEAQAREIPSSAEVWLVTYGPGEIYWQRFGHNGIWIRDTGLELDHVFNFGFFDFEQEGFLWQFLQGRLMYFSAAQPAQREFSQYIDENRSIRAQRLNLTAEQALSLADYLVNEVQAENREYRYDYYWNNCSTRVRDALDNALGGRIRHASSPLGAVQNQRDHTRRLTIADSWLYLGLNLGLGSSVDQPISRWDEFFIPAQLADGLAQMVENAGVNVSPLVVEDVMLFASTSAPPPDKTARWWPRFLLFSATVLALAILINRLIPRMKPLTLARSWLLVAGILGLVMIYLWFFTDHDVARNNLNLALFNPLWLLCWLGRRYFFVTACLLLCLGIAAMVATQTPPHQYTADVLAAFLPLNLSAAWVLHRARATLS